MALAALSAANSHTVTTRPAALSDVRPGRRQPTGSDDRFAGLWVTSRRRASGGIVAIAELAAHTACAKRPRGPVLASRQHQRPSLAPRRPQAGAPRRVNP